MKKMFLFSIIVSLSFLFLTIVLGINKVNAQEATTPIYRFYSPVSLAHFYTADSAEAEYVKNTNPNWNYEGIVLEAYKFDGSCSNGTEVYRFYNPSKEVHFYTPSEAEKEYIEDTNPNWDYEAVAYCAETTQSSQSSVPVFQFWSNIRQAHVFTVDVPEKDYIEGDLSSIYEYEGIVFYVFPKVLNLNAFENNNVFMSSFE